MDLLFGDIKNLKKRYLDFSSEFNNIIVRHIKVQLKICSSYTASVQENKRITKSVDEAKTVTWARIENTVDGEFLKELRKNSFELFLLKSSKNRAKINLGILMERYENAVLKIIFDYFESKNIHDNYYQEIDVIKHEVINKVIKNIDNYNPYKGSFYTWLLYVTQSSITDWIKNYYENQNSILVEEPDIYNSESNFNSPEENADEYFEYEKFCTSLLNLKDYPWKIITFILCKNDFSTKKIIEEFGNINLHNLFRIILDDTRFFNLSDTYKTDIDENDEIGKSTEVFKKKLEMKVNEMIIPQDYTAKKRLKQIYNHEIGKTCLNDYFSDDAVGNIHDWTGRVKKKIRDLMI